MAAAYLALVPLPNYNGASTKPDGENNFFASDPTVNSYKSNEGRLDYNISAVNRLTFEAHESNYINSQSNIFNNALSGTASRQVLWGGFLEDTEAFSPTLNLDFRLGLTRSENTSNPSSIGISPTTLGFAPNLAAQSTANAIPYLTFSDAASVPSLSGNPGNEVFFDTIQLFASLNKTIGKHNIKIGPDIRANKNSSFGPGAANGSFGFTSAAGDEVTSGTTGNKQAFGGAFALFELGVPTSGTEVIATRFQYNNWYDAVFAQDDWKVKPNFTVSMGLRVEQQCH